MPCDERKIQAWPVNLEDIRPFLSSKSHQIMQFVYKILYICILQVNDCQLSVVLIEGHAIGRHSEMNKISFLPKPLFSLLSLLLSYFCPSLSSISIYYLLLSPYLLPIKSNPILGLLLQKLQIHKSCSKQKTAIMIVQVVTI